MRNVKPRFNFDEADDDGAMSYFSDDLQDAGGVEDDAGQPPIVRNQRLGQKSSAVSTGYSNTRLVTKEESKRLKALKAEQVKRKAKIERVALSNAAESIRQQPELAHGDAFEPGDAATAKHKPHAQHDVKHFAAANTMIMFCDHCGRWQRHDAGRSELSDPCEEIREGSKSQRKLLRHGIIPGAGAKLPAHIRTSGGKRC